MYRKEFEKSIKANELNPCVALALTGQQRQQRLPNANMPRRRHLPYNQLALLRPQHIILTTYVRTDKTWCLS